jgi:predicted DNA-binding antitoxin AbrB/MazE fold protein
LNLVPIRALGQRPEGGAIAGARLDDPAARQKVLYDRAGQGVGGLDLVIAVAEEHRGAVLHANLERRQADEPGAQFSPLGQFDGQPENVPTQFVRRLANALSGGYPLRMTTTVDAIYENGTLVLNRPLPLPEKSHVRVTVESPDVEREAWLKLSEDSLAKVWNNDADDVFNELLQK